MNQRANGEGSIYRRADGRWTAACYVLRPDGTRVRRAVYGKTRKDAADQLAVLIAKTAFPSLWSRGLSSASQSTGSRT
jgi:integrase